MRYIFLLMHRISLRQRHVNHKFSCVTRHSPGAFEAPRPEGVASRKGNFILIVPLPPAGRPGPRLSRQRRDEALAGQEPAGMRNLCVFGGGIHFERMLPMEPHGQSPWFPRNAHKGRTSRTRGPIHPRVEPVVFLVRDRIPTIRFIKLWNIPAGSAAITTPQ